MTDRKRGALLIFGILLIGLSYQLIPVFFTITPVVDLIGIGFNALFAGLLAYFLLKDEFISWFKHFSFKWLLIGIPFIFIVSLISGNIFSLVSHSTITQNTVNNVLSWQYIATHVPIMLLGEELLSITLLYAAWKKLHWPFWQASIFCAVLFALWHLSSYGFNLLQIFITITPSRLVLNYLFKKTNSIWVTWIVHFVFDTLTFLFVLL